MLPFLQDQARSPELGEVEGERAVGNAEFLGDRARRHALVAGLNEKAEQGQAMLLGEGA